MCNCVARVEQKRGENVAGANWRQRHGTLVTKRYNTQYSWEQSATVGLDTRSKQACEGELVKFRNNPTTRKKSGGSGLQNCCESWAPVGHFRASQMLKNSAKATEIHEIRPQSKNGLAEVGRRERRGKAGERWGERDFVRFYNTWQQSQ